MTYQRLIWLFLLQVNTGMVEAWGVAMGDKRPNDSVGLENKDRGKISHVKRVSRSSGSMIMSPEATKATKGLCPYAA